jgi:hypothetical protein
VSGAAFDLDELIAEARAEAGLTELGSGYGDGLRMLARTYEENPFHERGRARNRRQLVRWLVTRLARARPLERHPDIARARSAGRGSWTGLPRPDVGAVQPARGVSVQRARC